eukprot:m.45013 g.45013  ORF g.45013 m.45013 type:complete len:233 (+) comp47153_c1_seq3:364-1062(+)
MGRACFVLWVRRFFGLFFVSFDLISLLANVHSSYSYLCPSAYHVYSDQEMHDVVRTNCLNFMERSRDHFEQFVDEEFDEYIRRKRHPRCYGNHLEIQAMSELYNRNIEVYCYSDEPINTFRVEGSTDTPIRVSYHDNVHYNAVVDPNHASFGLGLGFADFRPGQADRDLMADAMLQSEQEELDQSLVEAAILESSRKDADARALQEAEAKMLQEILWQSQVEFAQSQSAKRK